MIVIPNRYPDRYIQNTVEEMVVINYIFNLDIDMRDTESGLQEER